MRRTLRNWRGALWISNHKILWDCSYLIELDVNLLDSYTFLTFSSRFWTFTPKRSGHTSQISEPIIRNLANILNLCLVFDNFTLVCFFCYCPFSFQRLITGRILINFDDCITVLNKSVVNLLNSRTFRGCLQKISGVSKGAHYVFPVSSVFLVSPPSKEGCFLVGT